VKIVIAAIQTPFIRGGADFHIEGLQAALRQEGHSVERIAMPFRFNPLEQVRRSMEIWSEEDFTLLNGHQADRVICLQFPAYYVKHPRKVLWLLHQFRLVYDLWETPFAAEARESAEARDLRGEIIERDTDVLGDIGLRYANSRNVAARLQRFNGITAEPLYHPPFNADLFFTAPAENYIFAPSRLEEAKRQELLIRAIATVKSPIVAVLSGEGGQGAKLLALAERLNVADRVHFIGHVSDEEKLALYAHCLGVFFGPYDEDYGYVTLEAMLAAKPVITCTDSGGPLEFARTDETGFIVAPEPAEIARAVDKLFDDKVRAAEMGQSGRDAYRRMNITWANVVERLTEPLPMLPRSNVRQKNAAAATP
jgi:glycosyltransferase involved in cell wall biosynthesis